MANTNTQRRVESWLRNDWLPRQFGQEFRPKALVLKPGGTFDFDAVSTDGNIVVNISTSSGITMGGKYPSAKMQKLRADMLFLLMTNTQRRIILLTEKDMLNLCLQEKENGRVPLEIEFFHAEIPAVLDEELKAARKMASDEVFPGQR